MSSIQTVEGFNLTILGEGFYAANISKDEFDERWISRIYSSELTVM